MTKRETKSGLAAPLAHFAIIRYWDAARDAPPHTTLEPIGELTRLVGESRQRLRVHGDACLNEKQADEALRKAIVALQQAVA